MIYSPQQLANQLKLIRTKHSLSQSELAEKVGIKQSTLSNFENHPDTTQLKTVFKIIQALELQLTVSEKEQAYVIKDPSGEAW